MNQWWQYWRARYSREDCEKIIANAMTVPAVPGQIGHGSGQNILNTAYRSSVLRWLPRWETKYYELFGQLRGLFQEANKNAFGFDLSEFTEVQFTEYRATEGGKYDWHHDTYWTGNSLQRRKLSMVIQLSNPDDYDGGDLEFYQDDCGQLPDPKEIRQQGTVIIFPSFLRHRVTPVTRGLRCSLVTWYEGPPFR